MKQFPALTMLVYWFRICAVLSVIGCVLSALAYPDIISIVFMGVVAVVSGLTLWGLSELIVLVVDLYQRHVIGTEAQRLTYQLLKEKPVIKRLKNSTRRAS